MSSAGNGKAPEETPEPGPQVIISFGGPLSAEVQIRAEHVSPGQLYLAAWLLDAFAHEVRAGQVTQAAIGGLVTAPESVLADLRRQGRI